MVVFFDTRRKQEIKCASVSKRSLLQDPAGSESTQWDGSLFRELFEIELDPCPNEVADIYGVVEEGVITLENLQSPACGDWLSYEDSCYTKSSYLDLATDWEHAIARYVIIRDTLRRVREVAFCLFITLDCDLNEIPLIIE